MKKNCFLEIFVLIWTAYFIITLASVWAKEKVFHTVKKGETLESIAKSYNTTVEEIRKLNNLKTNRLKIGQKLVVEYRERVKESSKERPSHIYHTVKKGETLEKIAKTYGVTIEEIKEANHLKKNQIQVGQKLLIPEKTKKEESSRKKEKLLEKKDKGEEKEEALSDIEKSLKSLEERVKKLEAQPSKNKKAWLEIINEYRRLYLLYPGSKQAPKCLLKIAELHYKLYKDFGSKKDLNEAIKRYEILVNRYPKAEEVEQVYFQLAQIYKKDLDNLEKAKYWAEKLEKEFPKSRYLISLKEPPKITFKKTTFKLEEPRKEGIRKEEAKKEEIQRLKEVSKREIAREEVKKSLEVVFNQTSKIPSLKEPSLVADRKRITNVKPISGEDYTRVIIESSGKLEYQANILKESKGRPPRIYIDLFPASVDSSFPKELEIKDAHLTKIRVGQFDKNTVRVVLDLNSLTSYKIFSIEEPYQLILDLIGKEEISKVVPKDKLRPHKGSKVVRGDTQKLDSQRYINLARQLGLGVKRIVIDPGHGGEDPGAVNSFNGLREKEVTLKLAKILAERLQKELGVEVILTRDRDIFIPLTQRTAIANSKKADLFISLHLNASPDPKAKGIETYYLNFTTDPEAMRVAALENAMSDKGLSDLYDIVKAVLANTKLSESKLLAEKVQQELVRNLSRHYPYVEDRGVKYAPFLVLVGTRMPAILVEAGFISNPLEAELFKKEEFLEKIAEGIVKGIEAYVQSLKFSLNPSQNGKGS